MSIQSVRLTNFRGFRDHTVSLDSVSILVGQNNAGKSTFIDAVRLLAVGVRKLESATFQPAPNWVRHDSPGFGFRTSFDTVDFDFDNVHRNYDRNEPAKLVLLYKNRARLVLSFGSEPGETFFQVIHPRTGVATNRREALSAGLTPILVMPPIGPLLPHEKVIAKSRVREFVYGRLAHRHFRNQLLELVPSYRRWKEMLSQTWPGARVETFESDHGEAANELSLIIRDGPFATEAGWMGSGIQAWMQLLWFLCRTDRDATVVLDEPDVYLHADLQRKIVKLIVAEGFRQVAIATHSPEIISDVDPSSIVVIRKRHRYSAKPGKTKAVQDVIEQLGSRHNLQLSKLGAAKKVVLYEGEDQRFLSQVALSLGSEKYNRFMEIPYFDIKGVENWHQAVGVARVLDVATEGQVVAHLIIDRDFKTDAEISSIKKVAEQHGLLFHAWTAKEVENHFVSAPVLSRLISRCGHTSITVEGAQALIEEAAASLIDHVLEVIKNQSMQSNRRGGSASAAKFAQSTFNELRAARPLQDVVPGKRLISTISRLAKERFGCQLNAMNLCREFKPDEWPDELRRITEMLAT